MKVTVGTDIIEVKRIQDAMKNDKFRETVFTEKEIAYCESKKATKYQHYAGRFATKEAVFKAISKYLDNKYSISWKDIEILNDENGRPYANLINIEKNDIDVKEVKCSDKRYMDFKSMDIDVSISHIKDYAVASVTVTV